MCGITQSPKDAISVCSGLRLLEMVSKSDIGLCANEKAKPKRGKHKEDAGSQKEWIEGSHINWRREQVPRARP